MNSQTQENETCYCGNTWLSKRIKKNNRKINLSSEYKGWAWDPITLPHGTIAEISPKALCFMNH